MGEMDDLYVLSAIFVVLLVLVAASIFVLLIFSGLFSSINVETSKPPIGEVCIAYKDGTGPYSGVGSNFSECTSIAPDLKVIGLYYDDPKTVSNLLQIICLPYIIKHIYMHAYKC